MARHNISPWRAVLLSVLLLAACTTPPPNPPTPKPISAKSAPPGQNTSGQPGGAIPGDSGPGSPGSGEGYGAVSSNGAEVEEEEVAADGSSRVVSTSGRAAAKPAGHAHGSAAGGAPMAEAGSRAGGGTQGEEPKQVFTRHTTGMVGIKPALPAGSLGATEDQGSEAARSGNRDGVEGGRAQSASDTQNSAARDVDRLGVRGGRDEKGVTSGTPPPSSEPAPPHAQPQPEQVDILAQQLREAAENEKDPVLRDKLWAEYRKYKAGL